MIRAYTQTLKSYWTFSGRTTRSEFWLFVLTQSIIFLIGLILADVHDAAGLVLVIYLLGTLIPSMAVTVRRLHDTNRRFVWLPLGISITPIGCGLGTIGVYLLALGLGLGIVGAAFGDVFAIGEAVTTPFGISDWAPTDLESDLSEVAAELFFLGLALFAVGAIAGIAGGVLSITLLVFLLSPSTIGENRYGPQPENGRE